MRLDESNKHHINIFQKLFAARDGSRTTATSEMECFVIIVNGWKPLTIITKHPILDAAAALDPPLAALLIFTEEFYMIVCNNLF